MEKSAASESDYNYQIFQRSDESYEVEVSGADSNPTTVSSFASLAAAEIWVEQHKTYRTKPNLQDWYYRLTSRTRPATQ
jgi:hypothetical protein